MMGRLNRDPRQLFHSFRLDEVVPDDHLTRGIAAVLELSSAWDAVPITFTACLHLCGR